MTRSMLRALLLVLLAAEVSSAATLLSDTLWQGEIQFSERVRVEKGVTLTVAPGTRVVFAGGGLEVAGTLVARRALFEGDGWSGIELKGTDGSTLLEDVVVRGAKTGVFVGGGSPLLRRMTLQENDIGMEIKLKSSARVEGCRFDTNRKVGMFIKDDSTPVVQHNTFSGNGRFGAYIHRSHPTEFSDNAFLGNATGLAVSHSGSNPLIRDCRFENNELGVLVDRAALPVLKGNTWHGNATGLKLHRRSDAEVAGNLFRENELAVLVSFSSYPRLGSNDFIDNGLALRLEFQSSQWEAQRGAETRAGEVARQGAFGGQNSTQSDVRQPGAPPLEGVVHAHDNWWGEQGLSELERIGADGNPTFIDDGRDRPTFEEQGKMYPLDTVDFAPWSKGPNLAEVH